LNNRCKKIKPGDAAKRCSWLLQFIISEGRLDGVHLDEVDDDDGDEVVDPLVAALRERIPYRQNSTQIEQALKLLAFS